MCYKKKARLNIVTMLEYLLYCTFYLLFSFRKFTHTNVEKEEYLKFELKHQRIKYLNKCKLNSTYETYFILPINTIVYYRILLKKKTKWYII